MAARAQISDFKVIISLFYTHNFRPVTSYLFARRARLFIARFAFFAFVATSIAIECRLLFKLPNASYVVFSGRSRGVVLDVFPSKSLSYLPARVLPLRLPRRKGTPCVVILCAPCAVIERATNFILQSSKPKTFHEAMA